MTSEEIAMVQQMIAEAVAKERSRIVESINEVALQPGFASYFRAAMTAGDLMSVLKKIADNIKNSGAL